MKTLAATYCPCGALSIAGIRRRPTATLAALLKHYMERGFTQIVFLKMTCPDCFEARHMGVYAPRENQ